MDKGVLRLFSCRFYGRRWPSRAPRPRARRPQAHPARGAAGRGARRGRRAGHAADGMAASAASPASFRAVALRRRPRKSGLGRCRRLVYSGWNWAAT